MVDIKPRYLVMVTGSANNNKFYRQIPHGDTWTAEYGRIGASPQRRDYPMSQWGKKYNEKIKKGYVDQTDLVEDLIQVENRKSQNIRKLKNKVLRKLLIDYNLWQEKLLVTTIQFRQTRLHRQ